MSILYSDLWTFVFTQNNGGRLDLNLQHLQTLRKNALGECWKECVDNNVRVTEENPEISFSPILSYLVIYIAEQHNILREGYIRTTTTAS